MALAGPRGRAVQRLASVDHVVPVDQAIGVFTQRIKADPDDEYAVSMRAVIRGDVTHDLTGAALSTTMKRFGSPPRRPMSIQPRLVLSEQERLRQSNRRTLTRPFGWLQEPPSTPTTIAASLARQDDFKRHDRDYSQAITDPTNLKHSSTEVWRGPIRTKTTRR